LVPPGRVQGDLRDVESAVLDTIVEFLNSVREGNERGFGCSVTAPPGSCLQLQLPAADNRLRRRLLFRPNARSSVPGYGSADAVNHKFSDKGSVLLTER